MAPTIRLVALLAPAVPDSDGLDNPEAVLQ